VKPLAAKTGEDEKADSKAYSKTWKTFEAKLKQVDEQLATIHKYIAEGEESSNKMFESLQKLALFGADAYAVYGSLYGMYLLWNEVEDHWSRTVHGS
jgi:hypothetical protein